MQPVYAYGGEGWAVKATGLDQPMSLFFHCTLADDNLQYRGLFASANNFSDSGAQFYMRRELTDLTFYDAYRGATTVDAGNMLQGTTHAIAVTYDGVTLKVFRNGVLCYSAARAMVNFGNQNNIYIGNAWGGSPLYSDFYAGAYWAGTYLTDDLAARLTANPASLWAAQVIFVPRIVATVSPTYPIRLKEVLIPWTTQPRQFTNVVEPGAVFAFNAGAGFVDLVTGGALAQGSSPISSSNGVSLLNHNGVAPLAPANSRYASIGNWSFATICGVMTLGATGGFSNIVIVIQDPTGNPGWTTLIYDINASYWSVLSSGVDHSPFPSCNVTHSTIPISSDGLMHFAIMYWDGGTFGLTAIAINGVLTYATVGAGAPYKFGSATSSGPFEVKITSQGTSTSGIAALAVLTSSGDMETDLARATRLSQNHWQIYESQRTYRPFAVIPRTRRKEVLIPWLTQPHEFTHIVEPGVAFAFNAGAGMLDLVTGQGLSAGDSAPVTVQDHVVANYGTQSLVAPAGRWGPIDNRSGFTVCGVVHVNNISTAEEVQIRVADASGGYGWRFGFMDQGTTIRVGFGGNWSGYSMTNSQWYDLTTLFFDNNRTGFLHFAVTHYISPYYRVMYFALNGTQYGLFDFTSTSPDDPVQSSNPQIEMSSSATSGFAAVAILSSMGSWIEDSLRVTRLSTNHWALYEPQRLIVPVPATITAYYPGTDVSVAGWTFTGASLAGSVNEHTLDRASNATSPDLTTPARCTWVDSNGASASIPAGTWNIDIDGAFVSGASSGKVRLNLRDAGGTSVGISGYATFTSTDATYTVSVTTTGVSTQFDYEDAP